MPCRLMLVLGGLVLLRLVLLLMILTSRLLVSVEVDSAIAMGCSDWVMVRCTVPLISGRSMKAGMWVWCRVLGMLMMIDSWLWKCMVLTLRQVLTTVSLLLSGALGVLLVLSAVCRKAESWLTTLLVLCAWLALISELTVPSAPNTKRGPSRR